MSLRRILLLNLFAIVVAACGTPRVGNDVVVISVVGTNDVHGELLPNGELGGVVTISAYLDALRAARTADGGAVLVVDAGDMWQGTLESNLAEGADVVAAYNAMGVTAAAIGNHEFDFGPAGDKAVPAGPGDDPRGALKARAREARFPLLAANLIDDATGLPVRWSNVQPSIMVDAAGIKIGIVGVMTRRALFTTIAANTVGLRVAPLAQSITREAHRLRDAGAVLVIVAAHAGGQCADFSDPLDLSSCDMSAEIMQTAGELEPGLVDYIVAGHEHERVAHVVNGIPITSNGSGTESFGRVDFSVDRRSQRIVEVQVFPPQFTAPSARSDYEGYPLVINSAVAGAAAASAERVRRKQAEKLGATLTAPFELSDEVESPLANLFTEALLESVDGDIVIHNVIGGIRNGLPAGELTYGSVYEMFPFDNVISIHEVSGRDLRRLIARESRKHRRAGFAGLRVFVDCAGDRMNVVMRLEDGRTIDDDDSVRIVANDFLALGGDDILTPIIPPGRFAPEVDMPRTRDLLVAWFRRQDVLDPMRFATDGRPKWNLPGTIPESCVL